MRPRMPAMPLHGFSSRFKGLATWLSLLAVCSALWGPASALAQDMRNGKWIGLCSAGLATEHEGLAHDEGGHCEICALPVFGAQLPSAQGWAVQPAAPQRAPRWQVAFGANNGAPPAIRGPPRMS